MYADDTTLLSTLSTFTTDQTNNSDISNNINLELSKITDWLAVNKLFPNAEKTKLMIFRYKQRQLKNSEVPNIKINNMPIEWVTQFKFVGVIMDSNLTWSLRENVITNKLSMICGILSRLNQCVPVYIPNKDNIIFFAAYVTPKLWSTNMGVMGLQN